MHRAHRGEAFQRSLTHPRAWLSPVVQVGVGPNLYAGSRVAPIRRWAIVPNLGIRHRLSSVAPEKERAPRGVHVKRQAAQLSPAAIGLIIASAACFTEIDAVVKYLGLRYSVPLLVWDDGVCQRC